MATTVRRTGRRRWLWVGGSAIVLAVVAAAAAIALGLAGKDAAMARRALAEGQLDRASEAIDRWLRASPRAAEPHYLRARVAWARHDLGTAYQELELARALGYPAGPMGRLTGLILARVARTTEAEPYLRRAFDEAGEPDPEVAEALARIYLGSFRLTEAGTVLDRWAREVPGDARPYLLRTEVERRTATDPAVVIASYREALRRDPELDQARLGLADLLRDSHRNAEAAEEYARYLERQPNDPLGLLGAGQNALAMGDREKAARWLDRALALAPRDPVVLAARAAVEVGGQRYAGALAYSDRAVRADPFDLANRYQHMLILTRLGRKAEADAERQAVERIRKDQAEFEGIRQALIKAPQDAELRSRAATWLMTHGHEGEAVEWANLVLASRPAHPAMNRLLADYYRRTGQPGLANRHEAMAGPRP